MRSGWRGVRVLSDKREYCPKDYNGGKTSFSRRKHLCCEHANLQGLFGEIVFSEDVYAHR
jgi:hypothetical protein